MKKRMSRLEDAIDGINEHYIAEANRYDVKHRNKAIRLTAIAAAIALIIFAGLEAALMMIPMNESPGSGSNTTETVPTQTTDPKETGFNTGDANTGDTSVPDENTDTTTSETVKPETTTPSKTDTDNPTVQSSLDRLRAELKADGKEFAVIFLEFCEDYETFRNGIVGSSYGSKYPFLQHIGKGNFISASDGKICFAIIPTSERSVVTVHEWISDDGANTFHKGELLYSSAPYSSLGHEIIIVKCNFSDIFPDALITVTSPSGRVTELVPECSIKDGSLVLNSEQEKYIAHLTLTPAKAHHSEE